MNLMDNTNKARSKHREMNGIRNFVAVEVKSK